MALDQTGAQPATTSQAWALTFATIWIGQALSRLGSAVARFALVWWLTELTGSATVLATASLTSVVPYVVLGPIAGAYVDRWNRRVVMLVADSFIALVSLGLAYLFWVGKLQVWHIYVVTLARALGSIFHGPAMSTATALLVPDRHLARVSGINQTLTGVLNIAGPPLGALALAVLPLHHVMLVDVGTALLAILPLYFVRIPQPQREPQEGQKPPPIWADVRAGLRYIGAWEGLRGIMVMSAICNFVANPIFSLLPLLVTQHFDGGAVHLSWLQSIQGIGLIAGGIVLSVWGGFKRRILTSLTGLILQGITILIVGLAPAHAFWLAALSWGVGAMMNVFYNGAEAALLQAAVPVEMQGRVFTAMQSAAWIALPLSLLIAGPVADHSGPRAWYVMGGAVSAMVGVVALFVPAIRYIETDANIARDQA